MNKLILLLFLFISLVTTSVYAITEAHGDTVSETDAYAGYMGWRIKFTSAASITAVTRESGNTASNCRIYDVTGCSLQASGTFSGETCTFGTPVSGSINEEFYVVIDGDGGAGTRKMFNEVDSSWPIAGSLISWENGGYFIDPTCTNAGTQAYNIASLEVEETVASSAPYNVTNTWNVTSTNNFAENNLTWNSNGVANISSDLLSFTVDSSIDANMSCSIDNDWNYTYMVSVDANYKAATTETQKHSYTVYDSIPFGMSKMYCSWADSIGNQTANATASVDVRRYHTPNTTLISPTHTASATLDTGKVGLNVQFNFSSYLYNASVSDELKNCSLYGNFSDNWNLNKTITSVTNNTETNISLNITAGNYEWNVECCNEKNMCNQSLSNYTYTLNPAAVKILYINYTKAAWDYEAPERICFVLSTGNRCFDSGGWA